MTLLFWSLLAAIFVATAGYGLAILALSALLPRRPAPEVPALDATVLIAAYNEEACIGAKIVDILSQDTGPHRVSVCIASDGSTDRTAEIARSFRDPRVSVVEVHEHLGKIAALNRAMERIGADILVMSDANSQLDPGALRALLDRFGDPDVGGVCGAPRVAVGRSGWLGLAEHLYWAYDNALKLAESRLGGTTSAQGSLYAVRRSLIGPVPLSVADDFFISTQVVAAGKRLVFEPKAITTETVSQNTKGEFRRRIRSTERGWRGLLMRRALMNPLRHGAYALQLFFHKVLRRFVPFLLLGLFAVSGLLASSHWVYAAFFLAQACLYGLALAVAAVPAARRIPGASFAFFFVETQLAMALGLVRVALGLHSRSWKPVRDDRPATS
jgi:cellulose synthase/poly-beta-1,6-N-acetylglucosamine synthase-like glycosyltransferase